MKRHPYLYSTVVIFLVWLMISGMAIRYIPSPIAVIVYMFEHIRELLVHVLASMVRISMAIMITMVFGTLIGLALGRSKWADLLFSPLFYTFYPIPKISFLPLLILIFGIGNGSKIALVVLILMFQTILTIRDAVKGIPNEQWLAMKSMQPTKLQQYRHLILPAITPKIFTALRLSIGTGLSVLFFSENYATTRGIGYFIMDSWLKLSYDGMFSGIVAISLMGTLLFAVIDRLEHYFCPWNKNIHTHT